MNVEEQIEILEKKFENCVGGVWDEAKQVYYFINGFGQSLGHLKRISVMEWEFENYKNKLKENYG